MARSRSGKNFGCRELMVIVLWVWLCSYAMAEGQMPLAGQGLFQKGRGVERLAQIGVERLMMVIDKKGIDHTPSGTLVVALDDTCRSAAFKTVAELRGAGIKSDMDYSFRSLKGGLRKANKENRKYVIIIGEDEVKSGKVTLKDLEAGTQEQLSIKQLISKLRTTNS